MSALRITSVGRATAAALLALYSAACQPAGPAEDPELATAAQPAADTGAADTDSAGTSFPAEIYYDLTEAEWYDRGEPLRHAGAAYQPARSPVPMDAADLEPAGVYEGVRYYVRHGAARADTLYVPVYPRYWLPFAP